MKKNYKGFTLVEIMIVVAIIGIIIAIAVPAFLRARENSRGRACQENLAKIDGSKEQYGLEFKLADGRAMTMAQLITPAVGGAAGEGYLKKTPLCPAGGTYTVGNLGDVATPTCNRYDAASKFEKHELQ